VEPKSLADMIRLPSTFAEQQPVAWAWRQDFNEVDHPSKLDEAIQNKNMPAYLLNFHFATKVDLSSIGLGEAVYIPVQVSEREGGRKSIFFLDHNEEVLMGIYVTGEGIAQRFVKRVTGSGLPALVGDVYSTRITARNEELVFESREQLQRFDPATGEGHFDPLPSAEHPNALLAAAGTSGVSTVCYVWSLAFYQPDRGL
jgi:hypothetical protein